ncbi:MAG: flagellar biosynthetic protein FliO [Lachnospiraceae bacterium]|nr:flagellar biosynthetic protein FliO [Lachnospiraceae bacterium]
MDGFIQLLVALLIFVGVLLMTYYTTKYIAKLQSAGMKGKNISVIETQRLSNTKNLLIVKIGQEYYALASGKDTITVIGKLDSSGLNLPEENPITEGGKSYSESFSHLLEKFKKKQDKE